MLSSTLARTLGLYLAIAHTTASVARCFSLPSAPTSIHIGLRLINKFHPTLRTVELHHYTVDSNADSTDFIQVQILHTPVSQKGLKPFCQLKPQSAYYK